MCVCVCVCVRLPVCSDRPLLFEMNAFKHFTKIECPRTAESESEGLLPDCSVDMKETRSEDDSN